jgi:hypothetical protein
VLAPGTSFDFISAKGPWQIGTDLGGTAGQAVIPYPNVYANGTASVQFTLPPSSTILRINGTSGPWYGQYTVELDPPPPIPLPSNTFNSHRRYVGLNQTFFYAALDPDVNYTVTVTGDQDPSKFLGLVSWQVCFLNDPDFVKAAVAAGRYGNVTGTTSAGGPPPLGDGTPAASGAYSAQDMPTGSPAGPTGIAESAAPFTGSKTNVGAIAGGVVGGVVAAVLLGALIFFLCRRKTSQSKDE